MQRPEEGEVDRAAGGEPDDEEDRDRGDGIVAVAVAGTHRQVDECVSEKSSRCAEAQRVGDGLHGHADSANHGLCCRCGRRAARQAIKLNFWRHGCVLCVRGRMVSSFLDWVG